MKSLISIVASVMLSYSFAHATSGITYQGRILDPGGLAIDGAVQFRLQIRTPGAQNCLMYQELQSITLVNGIFSLTINDGTGLREDISGYGLDRIFGTRGTFTFDPTTCSTGSTFIPNADDSRRLQVYFKSAAMAVWEPMPVQTINFVPMAIESKQIAGYGIDSLLRFDATVVGSSPWNNTQYTELLALVAGTSTQYERAGRLGGIALPAMGAGQTLNWTGAAWTSVDPIAGVQAFAKTALPVCGANQFLKDNGAGLLTCVTAANSGGTVTQVDTGTGLTGGGFTTTGTISIAAGGVSATELAANAVTSAKILDGTIAGADLATNIAISTSGNITTTGNLVGANVSSTVDATRELQLVDPDDATAGAKRIKMVAPLAIA
ncbi:MAG: hypothetical protein V4692_10785, partial [Bdellovibrionota bacterium]